MGPTEEFERAARLCGYRRIAGIDEAGRGPLAGPVVAAAVVLPVRCRLSGIDDSKQLSEGERARLYAAILEHAVGMGIGSADVGEIDRLNILEATKLAMRRAIDQLAPPPDYLLIDAVTLPGIGIPERPIIKGDSLSLSIAAASILAKTVRDAGMLILHAAYPHYGFDRHMGYPTAAHCAALETHGASPVHRRSFGPVARQLALP